MALLAGTRIGVYEVTAPIGEGGMGQVYRAHDTKLDRDIALKILPESFANDPDRLMRFEREAKTLASLNHPHIAQIHGFEQSTSTGSGQAGISALVMELVEGEDLAARIRRGPIPLDEAQPFARQIAAALLAAHDAGIIHRDLKPANVRVRPDGTIKVLDFGLAKPSVQVSSVESAGASPLNSPTMTSPAFTQAGLILGTAAYMSPEQARGKPVDKRADIWAFGCVVYEMLTGRPPFPGDTITDVIAAVVKNEPDWTALPAATPAGVRRLLARCLRKDPNTRLRDIGDAQLELIDPDAQTPPGVLASTQPRRNARVVVLSVLAALLVGALGGTLIRRPAVSGAPRWTGVLMGGPAILMQPALSPDGQLLAFQTIVDGQSQVAVMKPGAGTWRVLTTDRTHGPVIIHDWSPDGSRIFYDRQTDTLNGIFAVPALGGDERLVMENAGYPAALPDGDLLVQRINANRQAQLHRFSPSTGRVDALPGIADSSHSVDAVLASADGRTIYFYGQPLAESTSPSAFYRLDLTSQRVERLASVNLRQPVSLTLERGTGNVLLGGVDGDAFQILRLSGEPGETPQALMTIPHAARFDADGHGGLYVALSSSSAELFAFPRNAAPNDAPTRLDTLPSMTTRQSQMLVPLPDGRVLIGARAGDQDRILVMQTGRQPTVLVDGDEETRPPATAVGAQHAAVMMGPADSPDIAIVNTADGRLVRRFKAPARTITTLGVSPDGRTLHYSDGGSIWSIPVTGGSPVKVGAGDSFTVEAESGELIVKLDEGARIRFVRMKPDGGSVEDIPLHSDLRPIPRPLMPGAARQGRLALAVASADSWFWLAATLDLRNGTITKLADVNPSDVHFVTWRADGVPIALGYGLDTALWRFTPRP